MTAPRRDPAPEPELDCAFRFLLPDPVVRLDDREVADLAELLGVIVEHLRETHRG